MSVWIEIGNYFVLTGSFKQQWGIAVVTTSIQQQGKMVITSPLPYNLMLYATYFYPTKKKCLIFFFFFWAGVESRASSTRQVLYHWTISSAPKNLRQCQHHSHFPEATEVREPGLTDQVSESQAPISSTHTLPQAAALVCSAPSSLNSSVTNLVAWFLSMQQCLCSQHLQTARVSGRLSVEEGEGSQPGGAACLPWKTGGAFGCTRDKQLPYLAVGCAFTPLLSLSLFAREVRARDKASVDEVYVTSYWHCLSFTECPWDPLGDWQNILIQTESQGGGVVLFKKNRNRWKTK